MSWSFGHVIKGLHLKNNTQGLFMDGILVLSHAIRGPSMVGGTLQQCLPL